MHSFIHSFTDNSRIHYW